MECCRFGNTDLTVSTIGLGCYGMSGVYGPGDDAESIATIRCALDLGLNLFDTSASYGRGHNHRLIGEAIRGRRHEVVIHSKSGSPRDGSPDAVRGGGDPGYLRQTCEESLRNLGIETLDVFCMSRVDPNVPIEESVGGMAELVTEGKRLERTLFTLDWHLRIDPRHTKNVERLDAEILQALLAGLTQITRITAAPHRVWAAIARAASLRVNDHIMSVAADRFADQAMIVALAIAGRCIEKIDAKIERPVNGGD